MLNKFLDFLFHAYDDLWIEVRRISPPSQRFFRAGDITGIEQDVEGDTNVFVGVLPRVRKGGKASDVVSHTEVLWADIDAKRGLTFDGIINSIFPKPNVIIDSGHGWHLYWQLDTAIPVEEAQQLMGDIAYVLGGDAVGDPARIMRLPHTLNVKEGQPAAPVRVLRFDALTEHRPQEFFVGGTERKRNPFVKHTARKVMNGEKTRSEELFAIAVDGTLKGQSRAAIVQRMREHPAGSKLDEMYPDRRTQWIDNALMSAKRTISQRQGR